MVTNRKNAARSAGDPGVGPAHGKWRGRAAGSNPANRFETLHLDVMDPGDALGQTPLAVETWQAPDGRQIATTVLADHARSVINRVDSPDLPFDWTINPYRGCEHGCIYCYARPTHELLGMSSGLDFETRLLAKTDAPALLTKELSARRWMGGPIVMSGITDPYQPIESRLGITRSILAVMAKARQPVSIVTKSRLVLRDVDLLTELARHDAVTVSISVTTLDAVLAAKMEPRAAAPKTRLWAIQRLASAGIPVRAMIAPVLPGLTDRETPRLLKAVADAGATSAEYILLRLPHQNKQLFEDWLAEHYPNRREHVLSLLRQAHGGELYDPKFGARQTGTGPYARQLQQTFEMFRNRYGLAADLPPLSSESFVSPESTEQLGLFDAA